MKLFAQLIFNLENTSSTRKKTTFLKAFFQSADAKDKVWAIALFTHRRPKRQITTRQLSEWAIERSGLDTWLFEESYSVVGDLAETVSLILSEPQKGVDRSLSEWISYLMDLKGKEDEYKKRQINAAWDQLPAEERFVFNKLITGGFRVGVSKNLITRALAEVTDQEATQMAHRLMGDWDPLIVTFDQLILQEDVNEQRSRPYPFYLAYPLEQEINELISPDDWSVEWKWDGIRSQLVKRGGELFIWSRGEELVTDKFPELQVLTDQISDGTVIDGELLPFKNDQPLSFALLQTRIGRKNVSKKLLKEAPVAILAYDLLEYKGKDIRKQPLLTRRELLSDIVNQIQATDRLRFSESIDFTSWDQLSALRKQSRQYHAEGFMLKRKQSDYKVGRKRGDWWKWKVDPLSIDAVMIYAQKGHGRRADIFSDYTFAVWDGDDLVPFAKAYSGLTDKEFLEVTRYVKANTMERFGPVRTVKATQVFEIHFEGIAESKRHKSGIAIRFPRIHRWRKDKPPEEANTLEDLKLMLDVYG